MITNIPDIGAPVVETLPVKQGKIYLSCFPAVQPVLIGDMIQSANMAVGTLYWVDYENACVNVDAQLNDQAFEIAYVNGQNTMTASNVNAIILAFQATIAIIQAQIVAIEARLPPIP